MGWMVAGGGLQTPDSDVRLREWVSLMETATEVSQTLLVRESAVRSLKISGLLGFFVRQAAEDFQKLADGGGNATGLGLQEQSSELGCRIWLLALRLMQVRPTIPCSMTTLSIMTCSLPRDRMMTKTCDLYATRPWLSLDLV